MTTFWAAIVNAAILSALLSLAVSLALRVTPRHALNAATRYAIWWLVLAITLALPLSFVKWPSAGDAPVRLAAANVLQDEILLMTPALTPISHHISLPLEVQASWWLKPIFFVWIVGSVLLLVRVFIGYVVLYRRSAAATALPPELASHAENWLGQAGARGGIRLAVSTDIHIPAATGPVRPAILIPAGLIGRMSAEDLERIVRHEAAHLARRDDLSLFAQRVVEALYALHPVVRWLTRQLDLEREIACDDMAVGSPELARSYAACLTRTVALCGGVRTSLAAANVADGRSHLSRRIALLVAKTRTGAVPARLFRGRYAVIAMALIGFAVLLSKTPQLLAFAVPRTAVPVTRRAAPPPATPLPIPQSEIAGQPVLLAQTNAATAIPAPAPAPAQSDVEQQLALANKQMSDKQFDAAIATYQAVIGSGPMDDRSQGKIWSHLGDAYRYKGEIANAIQALEKAVQLLPEDPQAATSLGLLYESTNDLVHARQYYERAIALDPGNPLALNNLSYLITETGGDLDLAIAYARAARQRLPNFLEIRDTLAWAYMKKDMPADAVDELKSLTGLAPLNPLYHYHYAVALNQQGNHSDALNECRLALADNPKKDLEEKIRAECAGRLP